MHNNRIYFSQSPKPTLGVEAELYTVSKDTFNLYLGAPAILDTFADDIHVKEELFECIVEVDTGICNNVAEVRSDLANTIGKVHKVAIGLGCREELEKLADIAENNQAPYKRQIIQYEKNNDLTDIVKDSIYGLREGIVFQC